MFSISIPFGFEFVKARKFLINALSITNSFNIPDKNNIIIRRIIFKRKKNILD